LDSTLLTAKCLEFIDYNCETIVSSDDFLGASLELIEEILDRDTLKVSEIHLYEALVRWSEEECRRRSLEVKVENQQQVLVTILPKVRFPLMTKNDFAAKVVRGKLLTGDEVIQISGWFLADDKPEINFISKPRKKSSKPEYCVSILIPITSTSNVEMQVNHDICLTGFGTQVNDPGAGQNNWNVPGPDGFYRHDFSSIQRCQNSVVYQLQLSGSNQSNWLAVKNTNYLNQEHFLKQKQNVDIKELNKQIEFNVFYEIVKGAQFQSIKLYFETD
jgi:hypothetical protein